MEQRTRSIFQPYRIRTLISAIHLPVDGRFPARTRARLEKALERLQEDKVIAGFHYSGWAEPVGHGWMDDWLDALIIVEPPDAIVDWNWSIGSRMPLSNSDLSDRLREKRLAEGLSRLMVAEQIGISPQELLHVERGRIPGNLRVRVERWLGNSLAS